MHKCKVIAIANQKGGVGKTTTAASLGVGLVRQGKKVMLIDADPQGSLSLSLGIEKPDNLETTIANVMERIVEDKEIEPGFAIVQTKEGIDLMPANIELSGIEVRLVNEMSRERVLKRYVDTKRQDYDFIIIDCMPSLGMMTFNALCSADSVIIPTTPEFLSAKGLEQLLGTINRVRRHINPGLKIDGILITMVDNRTRFGKGFGIAEGTCVESGFQKLIAHIEPESGNLSNRLLMELCRCGASAMMTVYDHCFAVI